VFAILADTHDLSARHQIVGNTESLPERVVAIGSWRGGPPGPATPAHSAAAQPEKHVEKGAAQTVCRGSRVKGRRRSHAACSQLAHERMSIWINSPKKQPKATDPGDVASGTPQLYPEVGGTSGGHKRATSSAPRGG